MAEPKSVLLCFSQSVFRVTPLVETFQGYALKIYISHIAEKKEVIFHGSDDGNKINSFIARVGMFRFLEWPQGENYQTLIVDTEPFYKELKKFHESQEQIVVRADPESKTLSVSSASGGLPDKNQTLLKCQFSNCMAGQKISNVCTRVGGCARIVMPFAEFLRITHLCAANEMNEINLTLTSDKANLLIQSLRCSFEFQILAHPSSSERDGVAIFFLKRDLPQLNFSICTNRLLSFDARSIKFSQCECKSCRNNQVSKSTRPCQVKRVVVLFFDRETNMTFVKFPIEKKGDFIFSLDLFESPKNQQQ